jgi:hypothetical protein
MTHQVYQVLSINGQGSKELAALAGSRRLSGRQGDQWLIQSRSEDGLNILYQLCIVQPRGREYEIKLPWEIQEPCPHCQGQGLTYVWRQGQAAYEAVECQECRGRGASSYDSEFNLVVSDGLGGRRVIRKSGAGRLNARLGLRGDLILNLTWVEELPQPEDSYAPEADLN